MGYGKRRRCLFKTPTRFNRWQSRWIGAFDASATPRALAPPDHILRRLRARGIFQRFVGRHRRLGSPTCRHDRVERDRGAAARDRPLIPRALPTRRGDRTSLAVWSIATAMRARSIALRRDAARGADSTPTPTWARSCAAPALLAVAAGGRAGSSRGAASGSGDGSPASFTIDY